MPPSTESHHKTPSSGDLEAKATLKELGFSESDCSIYFDLIDSPNGEAIETVLARSKEPSGRTEDSIRNLVDRGLLKVSNNRLEASEPKQFVSKLQEEKRGELSRRIEWLNTAASRLLSTLEPRYWEARLGIRPEDLLEPLSGLDVMELRTINILGNASRHVLISAETFGWFDKVREEVARCVERGVRFRLLMASKGKETAERINELKRMGIEVRHPLEDWYPVRGTLADDKELVFLIWAAREGQKERARFFRPHYSRNLGMIRVFADAFERRWASASKA